MGTIAGEGGTFVGLQTLLLTLEESPPLLRKSVYGKFFHLLITSMRTIIFFNEKTLDARNITSTLITNVETYEKTEHINNP